MFVRGRMRRQAALQRGRSTALAGCAAKSLMTIRNSGINGWRGTLLSSCARSSGAYDKNASRLGPVTSTGSGREAFLTTLITTEGCGVHGNSVFKSAKE